MEKSWAINHVHTVPCVSFAFKQKRNPAPVGVGIRKANTVVCLPSPDYRTCSTEITRFRGNLPLHRISSNGYYTKYYPELQVIQKIIY